MGHFTFAAHPNLDAKLSSKTLDLYVDCTKFTTEKTYISTLFQKWAFPVNEYSIGLLI